MSPSLTYTAALSSSVPSSLGSASVIEPPRVLQIEVATTRA